jgi:hypothetical protein
MGNGEGGGENQERKDTGFITYYVKLRAINTHMAHYVTTYTALVLGVSKGLC